MNLIETIRQALGDINPNFDLERTKYYREKDLLIAVIQKLEWQRDGLINGFYNGGEGPSAQDVCDKKNQELRDLIGAMKEGEG